MQIISITLDSKYETQNYSFQFCNVFQFEKECEHQDKF